MSKLQNEKKDYRQNSAYKATNSFIGSLTRGFRLSEYKHAKSFAKVFSVLFIISIYLAHVAFYKANTGSQSEANWSLLSFVAVLFSASFMSIFLGDIYWLRFGNDKNLDERQRAVKLRVIRKSYIAVAVLIGLSTMYLTAVLPDFLISPQHPVNFPMFEIIFCMLGLPSFFAAWEKDA